MTGARDRRGVRHHIRGGPASARQRRPARRRRARAAAGTHCTARSSRTLSDQTRLTHVHSRSRHRLRQTHPHRRVPGVLRRSARCSSAPPPSRPRSRPPASPPATCRKSSWAACCRPASARRRRARRRSAAGVPLGVPATTVNKMCGSGLKAVMMAADQIRAGTRRLVLAGGLESMTNAPYLLPKARSGYRMGHGEVHRPHAATMGCRARSTASPWAASPTRPRPSTTSRAPQQDAFATESVRRAMQALQAGEFDAEVAPVTVKGRKGETVVARDETPGTCDVSQDPQPEARLRQGRHGDGRQLLLDLRRRGRAGADERRRAARSARPEAAGAHPRLRQPRAGAGVVHHRAGGRDPQGARRSSAGSRTTPTSTRSTRRSRWSPWPRCATSTSIMRASTSTAAPARSATRSAPPARAS